MRGGCWCSADCSKGCLVIQGDVGWNWQYLDLLRFFGGKNWALENLTTGKSRNGGHAVKPPAPTSGTRSVPEDSVWTAKAWGEIRISSTIALWRCKLLDANSKCEVYSSKLADDVKWITFDSWNIMSWVLVRQNLHQGPHHKIQSLRVVLLRWRNWLIVVWTSDFGPHLLHHNFLPVAAIFRISHGGPLGVLSKAVGRRSNWTAVAGFSRFWRELKYRWWMKNEWSISMHR